MKNTINTEKTITRNEAKIEKAIKLSVKAYHTFMKTIKKATDLLESAGANDQDYLAWLRAISHAEGEDLGINGDTLCVENINFGLKLSELE